MSKKRWRIAATVAIIALMAVGIVIALDPFPDNRVTGSLGTREVRGVCAWGTTPLRFRTADDGATATVQLGEQTAQVTADRVELPGGRVVPIPAACKVVELRESRHGMQVFLDGIEAQ